MTNVTEIDRPGQRDPRAVVGDRGDPGADRRTPGRADHPAHRVPGRRGRNSKRRSRPKADAQPVPLGQGGKRRGSRLRRPVRPGEHRETIFQALDRTPGDRRAPRPNCKRTTACFRRTSRLTCCARLSSIVRSRRRPRIRRPCRNLRSSPCSPQGRSRLPGRGHAESVPVGDAVSSRS